MRSDEFRRHPSPKDARSPFRCEGDPPCRFHVKQPVEEVSIRSASLPGGRRPLPPEWPHVCSWRPRASTGSVPATPPARWHPSHRLSPTGRESPPIRFSRAASVSRETGSPRSHPFHAGETCTELQPVPCPGAAHIPAECHRQFHVKRADPARHKMTSEQNTRAATHRGTSTPSRRVPNECPEGDSNPHAQESPNEMESCSASQPERERPPSGSRSRST